MVGKQKDIVETKETMEKNTVKLMELAAAIGEIHTGETLEPVSESVSDKFKSSSIQNSTLHVFPSHFFFWMRLQTERRGV